MRRNSDYCGKQAGYMTVELLVALIVGAVLILSLNNLVTSHTYLSQRSRDLLTANAFAEQKIEDLRSRGYLAVATGNSDLTAQLPSELKAPRSAIMQITAQSTAVKKVRLNVTYNEQGTARTQVYTTYLGELGVGQN